MTKDVQDLLEFLPSIALFGGLEEDTLRRVIALMKEHHVQKGEEVCHQGETGRAMFLVREGEAVVYRTNDRGRRVKVVRMGKGEFFGEMSLIDIQKRSASVECSKESLLLSLSNADLYKLFHEDVHGYVMILQNLCRELSRRLRKTNARLQSLAEEADTSSETTLIRPALKRK